MNLFPSFYKKLADLFFYVESLEKGAGRRGLDEAFLAHTPERFPRRFPDRIRHKCRRWDCISIAQTREKTQQHNRLWRVQSHPRDHIQTKMTNDIIFFNESVRNGLCQTALSYIGLHDALVNVYPF